MRLRISVTQEHINRGIVGREGCDPVELAIKEVMPKDVFFEAFAGWHEIVLWDVDGQADHFDTPPEVENFLRSFDAGEKVQPFVFEIEV